MSPLRIAVIAASLVTILAATLLSADRASDRFLRSWVRRRYYRYRAATALWHLFATLVVTLGSRGIGWSPASTASAFQAAAHGVAWALTATALLRADFTGLQASETAPGFSLLRRLSDQIVKDVTVDAGHVVETALGGVDDADRLTAVAFKCLEKALPPSVDGAGDSVIKETLSVRITEHHEKIATAPEAKRLESVEAMRATIRELVVKNRIEAKTIGLEANPT